MPAVSIGIPFYNCAATLRAAVESVKRQTFRDWELILVDDGSTDDSYARISPESDDRIRLFRHKENRGLAYRLNEIAGLAKGEFLARMDADDLMHPQRIERQLQVLRSTKTTVVATAAYVIDDHGKVLGERRPSRNYETPKDVLRHNGPIHPTIMATREFFLRYPYVGEPPRSEDLILWVNVLRQEKVVALPERLHFYRENPNLDLAKYYQMLAAHRKVFCTYAAPVGGTRLLVELYSRSLLKESLYRLASQLGATAQLSTRRRLIPLTLDELASAQCIVDAISTAAAEAHRFDLRPTH
jgi:glycosyltransferase involved in cell wall biosynthesis